MITARLVEDPKIKMEWDKIATHPMQSWSWGVAREKMGLRVVRTGEFDGDVLKASFQMTVHSVPYSPFFIGYLPRSSMPASQTLKFLEDYGKVHNVIYIKIEPNVMRNTGYLPAGRQGRISDTKLKPSSTPLFPAWTQTIDLTKSETDLLSRMKPKTRYNIKLAQKKGVTVKEMTTDEGFEIFIRLYFETCKRQHYAGHNYEYHQTLFTQLKNTISHVLIAYYNDTPIAAYHLFMFNDVLYYPYGGSSDQYREVMGANLLMWEAMRFGKSNNCRSFDLWGSLSPQYDSGNIWSGFTRFKEGFGTQFVEMMGSYDLVVNKFLYAPLILAQKVREKFLGG